MTTVGSERILDAPETVRNTIDVDVGGTRRDERRSLPFQNKPKPLVSREMIVGVKERIDGTGSVLRPLDEEDVRRKVRWLADNGAWDRGRG